MRQCYGRTAEAAKAGARDVRCTEVDGQESVQFSEHVVRMGTLSDANSDLVRVPENDLRKIVDHGDANAHRCPPRDA
ncbi:hypothetical protein BX257_4783 [Streptomyces sp. 3212.3]|nr:hypothetical protein BX257_4783 [Streptomyces sp. 3212.3]